MGRENAGQSWAKEVEEDQVRGEVSRKRYSEIARRGQRTEETKEQPSRYYDSKIGRKDTPNALFKVRIGRRGTDVTSINQHPADDEEASYGKMRR